MSRPSRQRGAALLLLLVIAVIAFTTAIFAGYGKWSSAATTSRKVNGEALAQAKAALIGYVVKEVIDLSEDVPGRLPCPESAGTAGTSSEGIAAANCAPTYASQKSIGRLPWRTLGIDKLVDAESEPLWYAVSPNWVLTATGSPLVNVGTTGQLSFDGTADIVAIIFAPGRAISTSPTAAQMAAGCAARNQVRGDRSHVASGGDPDYRDYLECQNATAPIGTTFGVAIAGNESNPVINDQAVIITSKDVLNAIQGPLAERLQRTVAPLLSEYGDKWLTSSKFMPYAVPFSPPEANLLLSSYCGTGSQTEGLLPLAPNTGPCVGTWTGAAVSGTDITPVGCSAASSTSPVVCTFSYYRFTLAVLGFLGLTTASSVTATVQATTPHSAASFRDPLTLASFSFTSGTGTFGSLAYAPKTNGDIDMSVQATITAVDVCKDGLIPGLVCSLVAALGDATLQSVSVQFPQLGTTIPLTGSKLTSGARNGTSGPYDLLVPAASQPHYWFIQNEWYRYTYYAVAPGTSAVQAGGNFTINQFPTTAYGSNSDKRFVLTLMGPAVTGQARSATAAVNQYIEGDNAATTATPRVFAYQVFTASGNDRVATCPFGLGSSVCD
jgi:hypothetical protein